MYTKHPGWLFVTLGFGATLLLFAACGETGANSPVVSAPDGAADAAVPACDFDAGTCARSSTCCVRQAVLVNLEAKCRAANTTIFDCQPKACVGNGELGCFQRALPDGGVETFSTETTTGFRGFGSQFVECPSAIEREVTSYTQICQ